ncbi:MAG: phage adaptor protein [Candidatus Thorarchaeota archaeon]|jgi:hypothetical protein
MASPLTLDILRLLSADRADMLKYVAGVPDLSDFLEPGMFTYAVNHELASLWDHLITSYEEYAIKKHYIEIQANQEEYNLPADFYKIRAVYPVLPNGRSWKLRRFTMDDIGSETSVAVIVSTEVRSLRYRVMGNRLYFWPQPSAPATMEVWYIPQYQPLENNDDLIDFRYPNGWEDFVIEGVAARALEKEESDSTHCRTRQREILQRILASVQDRDVGEPVEMIDQEGYDWRRNWYD